MPQDRIRDRLADPEYRYLHLAAVSALSKIDGSLWYDAKFVRRFEAAQLYLAEIAPDKLAPFREGFSQLQRYGRGPVRECNPPIEIAVQHEIRQVVADLPVRNLQHYELERFGRHILHDHPYFIELQKRLLPWVSELVGCQLALGYNFLSLYGRTGKCEVHMDQPVSMFTLDYCIDQSEPWPISFSDPVDWSCLSISQDRQAREVMKDQKIKWEDYALEPGQALLFCGSSRWHYRKSIAPGGFCNLLFLHYYPAGAEGLVHPELWASHFGFPELEPFCYLFEVEDGASTRLASVEQ